MSAEPLKVLRRLHSKFDFNQSAAQLRLAVPKSWRVTCADELADWVSVGGPGLVLKPEYSRFATHVVIGPRRARDIRHIRPSQAQPWVAQERLEGRHVCTFSVAHQGRITAHAAYASEITAGAAATHFEHCDHPATTDWVTRFVHGQGLSGQLAFDFIDVPGRGPLALECNPRLTSGVHLFEDAQALSRAYLDPTAPRISPRVGHGAMVTAAVLLYGLPQVRSGRDLARITRALRTSRDVVSTLKDPLPGLLQGLAIGQLAWRGLVHGRSMTSASTVDIEYDGGA